MTLNNVRNLFLVVAFAVVALVIQGCSVPGADDEILLPSLNGAGLAQDSSASDMIYVRAKGSSTTLGSEKGKSNEQPAMTVKFDYDFSIGLHEVTCGEYNKLMSSTVECDNDSLPAVGVTFYDAVLYANARSVAEKLDTVYTYTDKKFDPQGNCIGFDGYFFNPDANGYRLPTEAEWVLVANVDSAFANSWNSKNSDNKLHKVCSLKSETTGSLSRFPSKPTVVPCDMGGNAMEWVNDWLGNFSYGVPTNYVGAPYANNLGERVVKGGSYLNEPSAINVYSRGDVYTVSSSTKADYVGFRLAKGVIPDPNWLAASDLVSDTRIQPLAGLSRIRSVTGTSRMKLVFRNDNSGNLVIVDYTAGNTAIVVLSNKVEVYHPEISPNGSYVAFCTKPEGVSGKSELYVQSLKSYSKSSLKLAVESAAIPRWRVTETGDTVIVYVTDAGSNKDDASFKSTSTWQVPFVKGRFGKPKKLFDGAFHDGISEDGKLAVTGARLLRTRIAEPGSDVFGKARDTLWYNGEQACNASLSKDGSKRTLFLDFAGKTGVKFAGTSYRTHERILVADSTGKLVQSIAAPDGYTFDHTEWVDSDLAVATLTDANGSHKKIALVDLRDSSVLEILEGEEVWHPSIWLGFKRPSENSHAIFDQDSAGVYIEAENAANMVLAHKMPLFWSLRDSIEIVGVGNSRMWASFVPSSMHLKSLNMGVYPCDMHCNAYLAENYVLNHCSNLKYLVLGVDLDLWYNKGEMLDLDVNMHGARGFIYDANHKFWKDSVDSAFVAQTWRMASEDSYKLLATDGWNRSYYVNGWVDSEDGTAEILGDSTWSDDKGTYQSNLEKLKDIIALAKKHDVVVVGVVAPMSPYYKKTGSYGRHGMRRSTAKEILEEIKSMADETENFVLLDENKMGDHDYPSSMAMDCDHLNQSGAVRLSTRIDSLIRTLEQ